MSNYTAAHGSLVETPEGEPITNEAAEESGVMRNEIIVVVTIGGGAPDITEVMEADFFDSERGELRVWNRADTTPLAVYAPGRWASAQRHPFETDQP